MAFGSFSRAAAAAFWRWCRFLSPLIQNRFEHSLIPHLFLLCAADAMGVFFMFFM